jgi:protocatechuate 3,4-dioxygenase beta subunit
MVNGDPLTARDGLVLAIRNEAQRRAILVDFNPIKDSTIGELAANFDVVLGFTPKA